MKNNVVIDTVDSYFGLRDIAFDGMKFSINGQPVFISEYGGIWWSDADQTGWGYGENPNKREEFIQRLKGLTDVLLDNPNHCGLCYTQVTDVEQEQNGLFIYQREAKFDPRIIQSYLPAKQKWRNKCLVLSLSAQGC